MKRSYGKTSTWMVGPIEYPVPKHCTCQAVWPVPRIILMALHRPLDKTYNRGSSYLVFYAWGIKGITYGVKVYPVWGLSSLVRTVLSWPSQCEKWNIRLERPPMDAVAKAAATVRTPAIIVYTLYDSSWSQNVNGVCCIVVQRPVIW